MTESSAYWDGSSVGDAASGAFYAPYDAETEFNRIFGRTLASDAQGFVIPNYLNNLTVQASSPAASTVDVETGAAYVKGFHYLNDALNTLTVNANASGNPRLDRVVLRIDWTNKTVRLAVLQGTAAATPTLPALTQVYGTTWEISLAYIYLANGFATIGNAEIHEERAFMQTAGGLAVSDLTGHNLIFNSEFMAYSDLYSAPPTAAPEGWDIFGTIPTIVSSTKYTGQPRGRALQMTAGGANQGIAQTFNVPPSSIIAIKTVMNVTSGDVGEIQVTTNAASPNTVTRTMRRTGSFIEEIIYYLTEADATTMTIREYCVNNTDVVIVSQSLAAVGFWPGMFREIHEHIIFNIVVKDASWDATAKSSSASTTIDLSSSFASLILPGTRAIDAALGGRDSASAAAADLGIVFLAWSTGGAANTHTHIGLLLAGETNDRTRYLNGPIKLNSSRQFNITLTASGVGTFDATIHILGVYT